MLHIKNNFIQELKLAEAGKETSLPFILHTLPEQSLVREGEEFQVIVVGGTVFRSVLCKKQKGDIVMRTVIKKTPPVFKTGKDFLSYVYEFVDPNIQVLSLNFAYPLKPVFEGYLDGVLLSGSKENTFDGLIGKQVGQSVAEMVKGERNQEIIVTCANDTVCLLLAGLSKYSPEHIFGGIIGTGVNFAFFTGNRTLVNLESANFDKFPIAPYTQTIDEQSVKRGALFEKEVSGAYLYKHFNLRMKEIDPSFQSIESTMQLEEIAHENNEKAEVARALFDHSAKLVACQIAGILDFKQKNMVGVMEGSLFWKSTNYKSLIERYVQLLTSYSVNFIKVDDDSVLGATMLVG